MPTHPGRLDQQSIGSLRNVEHRVCLRSIERQRFFTQHVLPRLEGGNHPLEMLRIGEADIHGIHMRIIEERAITRVHLLRFECTRTCLVATRDRVQCRALGLVHRGAIALDAT